MPWIPFGSTQTDVDSSYNRITGNDFLGAHPKIIYVFRELFWKFKGRGR